MILLSVESEPLTAVCMASPCSYLVLSSRQGSFLILTRSPDDYAVSPQLHECMCCILLMMITHRLFARTSCYRWGAQARGYPCWWNRLKECPKGKASSLAYLLGTVLSRIAHIIPGRRHSATSECYLADYISIAVELDHEKKQ